MNSINNNISALLAQRIHQNNSIEVNKSLLKLSTAQRINTAKDDPAGLIASENLRATLKALEAEGRNLQRASHVTRTADGALSEVSELLSDAEALVVANAGDGLSDAERQANQMELDSILSTVNRLAGTTSFNGDSLLNGETTIDLGPNTTLDIDSVHTSDLGNVEIDGEEYSLADVGSGGSLNIVNGDLEEASATIQAARNQVSTLRGRIGAFDKYTIDSRLNSVNVAIENISNAESQIRDTDFAKETANLSRVQLLEKASLFALDIANSKPSNVLALIA